MPKFTLQNVENLYYLTFQEESQSSYGVCGGFVAKSSENIRDVEPSEYISIVNYCGVELISMFAHGQEIYNAERISDISFPENWYEDIPATAKFLRGEIYEYFSNYIGNQTIAEFYSDDD